MKQGVVRAANWLIMREMVRLNKFDRDGIQDVFCEKFSVNNNYYYEIQNGQIKGGKKIRKLCVRTGISETILIGREFLDVGIGYEEFEEYYEKRKARQGVFENEDAVIKFQRKVKKCVREKLASREKCTLEELGDNLYRVWYFIREDKPYDAKRAGNILDIVEKELERLTWTSLEELSKEELELYCEKLDKWKEVINAVKVYKQMQI